jgi:uncharacterized OsmC-like protein
MSTTEIDKPATPAPRNGVDVPTLFATLDAVRAQPELAKFQFRATTAWLSGTHNATTISDFHGAGGEHLHREPTVIDADHPAVLVGQDHAPTPAEHLLQALGSCLMSGLANIASARGIDLSGVTARVEGDIDLLGILGLDDSVRNGFQGITVSFEVAGDADAQSLESLVGQAVARSAVYDVVTSGVPLRVRAIGHPTRR